MEKASLFRCDMSHRGRAILLFNHFSVRTSVEGKEMGQIEDHLHRGIALKSEGRYDEATAEFQSVLCVDCVHVEAHRQLGLVYGFSGLFDESIEELRKAVELDPENVAAHNDLALTYCMLGMMDEAKTEFEAVLSRDPGNETAVKNICYL
jgi:tetratricopeptide (TPR) repeat protein